MCFSFFFVCLQSDHFLANLVCLYSHHCIFIVRKKFSFPFNFNVLPLSGKVIHLLSRLLDQLTLRCVAHVLIDPCPVPLSKLLTLHGSHIQSLYPPPHPLILQPCLVQGREGESRNALNVEIRGRQDNSTFMKY